MAASRAAAGSAAVSRQLAGRAVHIKIHPRPRNLYESRQILRILERFGEVVMYKNLRYEYQAPAPNTALAIYQHASSASALLNASPIRFALQESHAHTSGPQPQNGALNDEEDEVDVALKEERKPGKPGAEEMLSSATTGTPKWDSTFSNVQNPGSTTDSASQDPAPNTPPPLPPAVIQNVREFQVTADMSTFNHQAYIERQAHYGGFNVELKTIVAEDLAVSVPLLGLADISTKKVEVPFRIQTRRAEELARRKTLKEIWEGGMRGK
ncbi:MAG: hypothetical protein M1830_001899 [Pleopsidium flavum]|nr:MAG: hypothetical protein M1830_001899 [Pleopsidium flavum]